ncbi:hypothetical protein C8R43DRAFT_946400 [Mycena crocata]|nr:hypothetical protein C8R43DRAFT_946400 [Mycena crocata]
MRKIQIPANIEALAVPPSTFIPCPVRNYMASNFKGHEDFSRKGNRTYWVLFVSEKQGIFHLAAIPDERIRADCLWAIDNKYAEKNVVGAFDTWEELLPVWAKNCYHTHRRCIRHSNACQRTACPEHPLKLDGAEVKTEIKAEPLDVIRVPRLTAPVKIKAESVKREEKHEVPPSVRRPTTRATRAASVVARPPSASPPRPGQAKRQRRAAVPLVPPPSYTPVPETEFGSDGEPLAPLFDSDSDSEAAVAALTRRSATKLLSSPPPAAVLPPAGRGASPHPNNTAVLSAASTPTSLSASVASLTSLAVSSVTVSTPSSPPVTSASSLSQSPSWAPPSKGKARAVTPGMSISQTLHRPIARARASVQPPALDDPFYVTAVGTIHHSSAEALKAVRTGGVTVVIGWDEATKLGRKRAEKLRESGRINAEAGPSKRARAARQGDSMDVDE